MVKHIKLGVWGVGRIGSLHARNIAASDRAKLVAIADPITKRAKAIADRFRAHSYDSPARMLRKEKLDGVIIATPTAEHAEHVNVATDQGVAVFLEKPIAMTLSEAKKIVTAAKRPCIKVMIGFNRRSDVSFQKAKEKIANGKIGKPLLVKVCARDPEPPREEYVKSSGGIFVDQCIHDIDIALWFMNEYVRRVSAVGKVLTYPYFEKYGDYDNAVAILEFESGVLGIIEGSRSSSYGYDLRTEVLGNRGGLRIENWNNDISELWKRNGTHVKSPYPWFIERFAESYRLEINKFCNYIMKGGKSPVSAEEGLEALKVAIAARESAHRRRAVTLQN